MRVGQENTGSGALEAKMAYVRNRSTHVFHCFFVFKKHNHFMTECFRPLRKLLTLLLSFSLGMRTVQVIRYVDLVLRPPYLLLYMTQNLYMVETLSRKITMKHLNSSDLNSSTVT